MANEQTRYRVVPGDVLQPGEILLKEYRPLTDSLFMVRIQVQSEVLPSSVRVVTVTSPENETREALVFRDRAALSVWNAAAPTNTPEYRRLLEEYRPVDRMGIPREYTAEELKDFERSIASNYLLKEQMLKAAQDQAQLVG